MLSRWNFYRAITLANTRLNTLALHRPCVLYSVCSAHKSNSGLGHRPAPKPWYGHSVVCEDFRLYRHYSSSEQPPLPPPPIENDDKSQNIFQRFKNMAKKYWYIVLPVHMVTSTIWFGSFYFIASSGVDVPALLESLGFPDWITDKVRNGNSWTSYLVIAYGLYKICTPFRYMVTLGGTTMVIRYLQKIGYVIGGPARPKKP